MPAWEVHFNFTRMMVVNAWRAKYLFETRTRSINIVREFLLVTTIDIIILLTPLYYKRYPFIANYPYYYQLLLITLPILQIATPPHFNTTTSSLKASNK